MSNNHEWSKQVYLYPIVFVAIPSHFQLFLSDVCCPKCAQHGSDSPGMSEVMLIVLGTIMHGILKADRRCLAP